MAEQGHEGLGLIVEVGDGVAQSPGPITAIAIANGVMTVTETAHSKTTGDVVTIDSVTGAGGLAEAVNRSHLVTVVDVNDYKLSTPAPAGAAYTSGGNSTSQNTVWAPIPGVTSGDDESTADEIDVTNIRAIDSFRSYKPGLKASTWTINMNYLPEEAQHIPIDGLLYLFNARIDRWIRLIYPQVNATNPPYSAYFATFLGMSRPFDMEGKIELNATGRFSGPLLAMSGV